jgi:predicted metalloendopeptidase
MNYILDIFIKTLFLDFKNIRSYEFYLLEKKIDTAKVNVRFKKINNIIVVENEEEIRKILGYHDTLGMALFIRWYICMDVKNSKCAEYLLREK